VLFFTDAGSSLALTERLMASGRQTINDAIAHLNNMVGEVSP
jgi:hypothetical protein